MRQPDRIAHRRRHIEVCTRERALFRRQPSVAQLDRSTDEFETVQRFSDRRHGVSNKGNSLATLRRKCSANRNGIDMNSIDDKTSRQSIFGQRRTNDPGLPRTQRRHCIEKMGDAGCSIRDCLRDNGRGRLAVTDRYPHTRCGQGPDEASRNAFRRQRNNRPSGVGEFAQSLQVTRPGLHDPIWSMDARTPRTDERTFQVQAEYTVPPTDRATAAMVGLNLLAGVGDQSRKTAPWCQNGGVRAQSRACLPPSADRSEELRRRH